MTMLASFPSEPRGEKIHQPESQSCCYVVAAGISFAFVDSPGMTGDGNFAVCAPAVFLFQYFKSWMLLFLFVIHFYRM